MVIAIVLSSFVYLNSQKPYSGNIENVSYAGVSYEYQALVDIAQDQHFFAKNGINLTMNTYVSGVQTLSALSSHAVDISFPSEFAFVGSGVLQQQNFTVVASIDKYESVFLIFRNDSGIKSTLDLSGKRIGLTLQTLEEFYLGRFLDLQGLNIHDVTLVNIATATEAVNAITNGTVDALVTVQAVVDQLQSQLGNNITVWPVQSDQFAYALLVCRSDWVVNHPDTVVRLLKSISEAENYFINHRASAEDIVDRYLNRTVTQEAWSKNQFSLSLDQSLLLAMQDEAQWLVNNNLTDTTSIPNFLNYIYFNGLETVNPTSVTITH